ncbi:hypothetical protein Dimus_014898 [Dionaea muscipula]
MGLFDRTRPSPTVCETSRVVSTPERPSNRNAGQVLLSATSHTFLIPLLCKSGSDFQVPANFLWRSYSGSTMSCIGNEEVQGQDHVDNAPEVIVTDEIHAQETGHNDDQNEENLVPCAEPDEQVIKKKYGGMLPKKPPLISKDHERAFFDSADWALGKQGAQKPKGPVESLRPKLLPTPQYHQARSRRLAYASSDGEAPGINSSSEGEGEDDIDKSTAGVAPENQKGENKYLPGSN